MGFLVPYLIEDIMPSDSIKLHSEIGMKSSQLYAPIMQEIKLHKYSFFVPYRILYKHFNDMLTRGIQGNLDVPNQTMSIYQMYRMIFDALVLPQNDSVIHFDIMKKLVKTTDNFEISALYTNYQNHNILINAGSSVNFLSANSYANVIFCQLMLSDIMRNFFDRNRYPQDPRTWSEVLGKVKRWLIDNVGLSDAEAANGVTALQSTNLFGVNKLKALYYSVVTNACIYRIFGPGSLMDYLGYPSPRNIATVLRSDRLNMQFTYGKFTFTGRKCSVGQMCYQHSFSSQLYSAVKFGIETMTFTLHRLYAYLTIFDEYFRDQNLSYPRIPRDFPYSFSSERHNQLSWYTNETWNFPAETGIMPITSQPFYDNYRVFNNTQKPIVSIGLDFLYFLIDDFFGLQRKCWTKDYFTSALPWTQRGSESVMSIQTKASSATSQAHISGNTTANPISLKADKGRVSTTGGQPLVVDVQPQNGSFTIRDLREANRVQLWLERNAAFGGRVNEMLNAHYAAKDLDARLWRPQVLDVDSTYLTVDQVIQTSATQDDSPQGNQTGLLNIYNKSNFVSEHFEEFGFVINLLAIMPEASYQDGLNSKLRMKGTFDFPFAEFAHLGEQPIRNDELFVSDSYQNDTKTFGYTPRYAPWQFHQNEIHGTFKSSLSFWHMGRIFDSTPALNEEFVESHFDLSRWFAIGDTNNDEPDEHFFFIFDNNITVNRALPDALNPTL